VATSKRRELANRIRMAWRALRGRKELTVTGRLRSLDEVTVDPADVEKLVNDGYKQAEVVYACVRAISTSANDVPVRVTVKGEVKDDHPLAEALARPWPWLSRFELLEATLTYLNVAGKSFWWKRRSGAKRVVGLYPLRADLVKVKAGKTLERPIEAYEYRFGHSLMRFPPEDVVYFRFFDPLSDIGAFPPLAVGMDNVDADNLATRFVQYFFRRGAMLGGLLSTEARLEQGEVDFLKELWRQQYAGLEHWGEVAVLSHGAKYQQLGITMEQMAFPELRMLSESRICMIFGVPPIIIHALVGLQHATYANFEQAQRVFWANTLSPLYGRLADKMTVDLGAEFGKDVGVRFAINEVAALQEKRDAAWGRADQGVSGGWAMVNEGRAEAGLPAVQGGDVFLRGLAVMSESGRVEGKALVVVSGVPLLDERGTKDKAASNNGGMGDEAKERHSQHRDLISRAWEGRFTDRARELFDEEVKTLKQTVQDAAGGQEGASGPGQGGRKQVAWMGVLFSVRQLMEGRKGNWRDGFLPLFRALLGMQGETISADFGIDFSLTNPLVLDWISGYSYKFADKLVNVSAADLAMLVGQAQNEGWSVPKLQDELQSLYDGWSRLRAEMIARTETIRSSNAGARMAYRGAGVKQLQWWATLDERLCPFCGEMHKTIIGIEELFWKRGEEMVVEIPEADEKGWKYLLEFKQIAPGTWEWVGAEFELKQRQARLTFSYEDVAHPPLHPNCRCTVLPVLEPGKVFLSAGRLMLPAQT
jgi:HK97 family phage portal protein